MLLFVGVTLLLTRELVNFFLADKSCMWNLTMVFMVVDNKLDVFHLFNGS